MNIDNYLTSGKDAIWFLNHHLKYVSQMHVGLANAAWAFGKLRYVPDAVLPALIAKASIDKIADFRAQNLSNLLLSCAYLNYRNEELWASVAKQVRGRVVQGLG